MRLDRNNPFLTPFMLRVLRLLAPRDVQGVDFVRKGIESDGGYVMVDDFANVYAAYSLGIGHEASWDLAIADLGLGVWQYDPTVEGPPTTHPKFQFRRVGIAAQTSADRAWCTLESLIVENGHEGQHNLILKMDIEGAEWDVLPSARAETLEQFSQVLVELHGLCDLDDADKILRVLDTLAHLSRTHQSVHVHGNNWAGIATIGGITIPDALEVTFVRRSDHQFVPCQRTFPTRLDFPNHPDRADYFLGAFGNNIAAL
jgi:hypothetical protein